MNTSEIQPPKRTFKDYLGLTTRGFVMGAADVVPGVSGGTMAFILGIYEELINSIRVLAICAMILPGISGAFILVLLGKLGLTQLSLKTHPE